MGCASSGPHTGLVNAAQDAAGETEKAAEGAIHGFGDQAKETITHGVEHVKDAMSSAVTSVEHGLTTAVDTIGDSLGFHNKDKEDSDEKLKNALEVADRTSEAETVEAEDLMDQLLNETKDVSSGVESMTAATMDEVKGEMKKVEDTMTETTSDMQDKMEAKMVEIIDASVDQAAEIQEKAEMATKKTLDHIDMMGEMVDTTVTSKIEEMNDMVDETLEVTVDEVNKQVEQIVQKIDGDETKTVGEEAVEPPGTPETDAKTEPEVEEPTSMPTLWERAHDLILTMTPEQIMQIEDPELAAITKEILLNMQEENEMMNNMNNVDQQNEDDVYNGYNNNRRNNYQQNAEIDNDTQS